MKNGIYSCGTMTRRADLFPCFAVIVVGVGVVVRAAGEKESKGVGVVGGGSERR